MLMSTRKGYTDSYPATFALFRTVTKIDQELEEATRGPRGDIKWHQAIRNVAKVHKNKNSNNALMMSGELIALEGGGFALPNKVPKGRTAIVFPIMKGLDVKAEPKPKKLRRRPLPTGIGSKPVRQLTQAETVEVHKVVAGLRRIVSNMRDDLRDNIVVVILDEIKEGRWTFEDIGAGNADS